MAITKRVHEYRVRVHVKGTTTPGDGTVDFTLDAQLSEIPKFGGQTIRPMLGRSEMRPWSFRVVDKSEIITNELAASGRMHLIGRLVELQTNVDAGGWTTREFGRLSDLSKPRGKPEYDIRVSDETWILRNTEVFTNANTTSLYPPGTRYKWPKASGTWFREGKAPKAGEFQGAITSGNFVQLTFFQSPFGMPPPLRSFIEEDKKEDAKPARDDGSSNFESVRLEIDGDDSTFPVIAFGDDLTAENILRGLDINPGAGNWLKVWVRAPSGLGTPDNGFSYEVRLVTDGLPPSADNPLHTGTRANSGSAGSGHTWDTNNPHELAKKICQAVGARIDTTQFDALEGVGWEFRIKSVAKNPMEWLERHIWGPTLTCPFIDNQGRIAPRKVHLPSDVSGDDEYFDPATAYEFNKSNIIDPPTWDHTSRDLVNRITFSHEKLTVVDYRFNEEASLDLIKASDSKPAPVEHDNVSDIGPKTIKYHLEGLRHIAGENMGYIPGPPTPGSVEFLKQQVFGRVGDGPIRGIFTARYVTDQTSTEPGKWVKLNFDDLPNPSTNDRGGTRFVQILRRTKKSNKIEYEYLDGGESLQPLATPTVAIALQPAGSKHCVRVTLSSLAAGATAGIELGFDNVEFPIKFTMTANGTRDLCQLPSNTTIYARGQARAENRISSDWSTTVNVTTAAYTAPGISVSDITGTTAVANLTANESLPIRLYIDEAACPGDPEPVMDLEEGIEEWEFEGLTLNQAHCAGATHVDPYEGETSMATDGFTTGATKPTCPDPAGIIVLHGAQVPIP